VFWTNFYGMRNKLFKAIIKIIEHFISCMETVGVDAREVGKDLKHFDVSSSELYCTLYMHDGLVYFYRHI
jgi:uncharacterized protein Smg (DUF494 family)